LVSPTFNKNGSTLLATACVLILVALFFVQPFTAIAMSYSILNVKSARFNDLNGDPLRVVKAGEQVVLTTTFYSVFEEKVDFVGIIEVRDTNGVTVSLSWQTGSIEPQGNKTIGVSWLVPQSTAYQSRAFAISDFEHPRVFSAVETFDTDMPCVEDCIAH
jgi:hypothetical protein